MKSFLSLISILMVAFGLTACGNVEELAQNNLYPLEFANKTKVPDSPPAGYQQELLVVQDSNVRFQVHLWSFRHSDEKAPVLIHFHGNGENLGSLEKGGFLKKMETLGFSFVVFDYPGYGKSTGVPTEASLMAASEATLRWTQIQFPNRPIYLWGWSIGTGPTTQMTVRHQDRLKGAVLTSPFTSVRKMAKAKFSSLADQIPESWYQKNEWNSLAAAPQVRIPVLVQHGTKDQLIPFQMGRELFESFPKASSWFYASEGKGHGDVFQDPKIWDDLKNFVK